MTKRNTQNGAHKPTEYLSLEQGSLLVQLARRAVANFLDTNRIIETPSDLPEVLREKSGVFVTLNSVKPHELRGCIGFPYPEEALAKGTIKAAIYAATEDPRFSPLSKDEFVDNVVVEVTVLTPPRLLEVSSPKDLPALVEVGLHGLIVERGGSSGLLLPQVATEWGWDASEFLTNCCMKAGLMPDSWLLDGTRVKVFEGEIFEEVKPAGEVKRKRTGVS